MSDPFADRFEIPLHGVVDRDSESDGAGDIVFPVLESSGIGPPFVFVRRGPVGRSQIDEWRFQHFEHFFADVEKSDARGGAAAPRAVGREALGADGRDRAPATTGAQQVNYDRRKELQ